MPSTTSPAVLLLLLSLAGGSTAVAQGASQSAMAMDEGTTMVGGQAMFRTRDIVDNAVNSADHTTLVAAVKAAGLVETLKGAGPFTVFAPTNPAFAALPEGTVDGLLQADKKQDLTKVLTYHVVAGAVKAADLKDGQKIKTL